MKSFFKNKIVTILVLVATLVLAGIAIFTAIRLYQLRQQPVAPTAPTSEPKAATPNACTALTFTLSTPTATPTGSPTATPTGSPTATPTGSPTSTPTPTATATSSPVAQASPTAEPSLPEAGTSWPTIVGLGVGILLLLGSLLLAL